MENTRIRVSLLKKCNDFPKESINVDLIVKRSLIH